MTIPEVIRLITSIRKAYPSFMSKRACLGTWVSCMEPYNYNDVKAAFSRYKSRQRLAAPTPEQLTTTINNKENEDA